MRNTSIMSAYGGGYSKYKKDSQTKNESSSKKPIGYTPTKFSELNEYYQENQSPFIDKNENKDQLSQNIRRTGYANLRSLQKQKEKEEKEKIVNKAGNFILRYNPVSLGAQYIGKKILQKQISGNIDPYSYNTQEGSWKNRFINSVFNKESNRKETEKLAAMGVDRTGAKSTEPQLRLDLLNMYSGLAQKYNSFVESKYKPSIGGDENERLYDSPKLKNEIFNLISKNKNLSFTDKDDLKNKLFSSIGGKIGESGDNISTTLPALGQGTLGVGEDKKGVYISYSDKWDINPSEGVSSESKSGILKNALNFATKKAEEYGVVTPPKIYGRIYLDKKTGLPIKD